MRVLRRAGLARDDQSGDARRIAGARGNHDPQTLLHLVPRRVFGENLAQAFRRLHEIGAPVGVDDFLRVVRAPNRAAVGQRGCVHRHLDRRHGQLALTAGQVDGVALVPALARAAACFGTEQMAGFLAAQRDVGLGTQAEGARIALDQRAAGLQADVVEVDVARLSQAHQPGNLLVAFMVPAQERVSTALEMAGAEERVLLRDASFAERRQAHDRLERRARRIGAGDGVVELRQILRVALDLLGIGGQQGVRIEVRLGRHRQNIAVARIDRNGRAASGHALAQAVVRGLLHGGVDRQMDIAPGFPRHLLEHALQASLRVHFHTDAAVASAQLVLERAFQPHLADARLRAIALRLPLPPFARVHLSHEAQQMGRESAVRIGAARLDDQVHAGIQGLQLRQLEHGGGRQIFGQARDRLLALRLLQRLEQILRVAPELTAQLARQGHDVLAGLALAGQENQRERGLIRRQGNARAVVDAAPRRGLVDHLRAIAFGGQPVLGRVDDLQLGQAQAQHRAGGRDRPPHQFQPLVLAGGAAHGAPQNSHASAQTTAIAAFKNGAAKKETQPTHRNDFMKTWPRRPSMRE